MKKFEQFSYSKLLGGRLEQKINGKMVIFGVNASGLSDYVVTETSNRYPGSEIPAVSIISCSEWGHEWRHILTARCPNPLLLLLFNIVG